MIIDFSTLNKERFEELCKRILISEYPDVKTIDGSGGDQGVDSFIGKLNGKIKIWQFKYFLRRLNQSRKTQIKLSLKTAKEKHLVKEWILCLPLEFSLSEEKWFQELTKENKDIKISYLNEHHLRNLIQKHKFIRDEFFRGEEKEQLDRIEKAVKVIQQQGEVSELFENQAYIEQISAFKIRIINQEVENVVSFFKESIPFRQGLGFKKFKLVEKGFYKSFFYLPAGKSTLRLNIEDEENPFRLTVPYSTPIEVWIRKDVTEELTIPKTQVTFFTSNYGCKHLLLKLIKENLPESAIVKEIDFHTKIKGMISSRNKFSLSTTTVKLDPNIIEKVRDETGRSNKDVEIRSNIIHAKKGGLPETEFMQKALSMVKTIRKEGKTSEILFFRAKKTTQVVTGKVLTVEVHNDGRVRMWFKKRDYEYKKNMMKHLDSFIDSS